jgi:5-hydroxyisourate hydrolase
MSTLSTHVLDTSAGRPARGLRVFLADATGAPLGDGATDADGRIATIGPERLPAGDYRLTFDTGGWFAGEGTTAFYPEVVVAFTIADADQHHHVPLLLNPFGYSTYRGT